MIPRLIAIASLLALIGWGSSCGEPVTPLEQAQIDRNRIEAYVEDRGLDGQFTGEGIYYEITAGADTAAGYPASFDTVIVVYEGLFLNGEVFDRSGSNGEAETLSLSAAIDGWQDALPLFNRGATGYFIVPSGLAYGPNGYRVIPPNTVLRFNITLQDFY